MSRAHLCHHCGRVIATWRSPKAPRVFCSIACFQTWRGPRQQGIPCSLRGEDITAIRALKGQQSAKTVARAYGIRTRDVWAIWGTTEEGC